MERMTESPLTIVIPARNEALRIPATLQQYCQHFHGRADIMVVLNGCTDDTLMRVQLFISGSPNEMVQVVNIPAAIGKGGAVIEGFRRATGKLVGFVDADGSTSPREFDRLVSILGTADGVIASRWAAGATVLNRTSVLRRIASYGFVRIVKFLFDLPYADTQCGAKVFQRRVISVLLPDIQLRDMAFDVELLLLARQKGFTIREEPTTWVDKSSSTVVGSPLRFLIVSARILVSLIRLYWRQRQFKPL